MFESKISAKELGEIKVRCLQLPGITHDERAKELHKDYPDLSLYSLSDYSRVCLQCTEKVFNLFVEGKIKLGILHELCSWEDGDQDFIIDEFLTKGLTISVLEKIRRYRKEHGWSFDECIAKATGQVPLNQPRKGEGRKSLDSLLSDIADKGARWRAMVAQAIEMVAEEEAAAGIHEAIFTKVYLLRELIGNQYDFVNNRLNRYMNLIRKRLQNGGPSPVAVEGAKEEGGSDA